MPLTAVYLSQQSGFQNSASSITLSVTWCWALGFPGSSGFLHY